MFCIKQEKNILSQWKTISILIFHSYSKQVKGILALLMKEEKKKKTRPYLGTFKLREYIKLRWGRKWQPTPVFLPGKFHGQRRVAGATVQGLTRAVLFISWILGLQCIKRYTNKLSDCQIVFLFLV